MKRIMRILIIAVCCMMSFSFAANAGNDKPINVKELPAKAQTLLSKHFKGQKVMLATIESGVLSRSYDVVLRNGTKLEFDKKGIVPSQLIPQPIKNYLKENYKGQSVRKIEFNTKEYEVELTNGIDLTFNRRFQLIDID